MHASTYARPSVWMTMATDSADARDALSRALTTRARGAMHGSRPRIASGASSGPTRALTGPRGAGMTTVVRRRARLPALGTGQKFSSLRRWRQLSEALSPFAASLSKVWTACAADLSHARGEGGDRPGWSRRCCRGARCWPPCWRLSRLVEGMLAAMLVGPALTLAGLIPAPCAYGTVALASGLGAVPNVGIVPACDPGAAHRTRSAGWSYEP
jgi:hypothetical protein